MIVSKVAQQSKFVKEANHPFICELDEKIDNVLSEIEKSELYLQLSSPDADARLVANIIKYIMLEVFSYGPHVTEATLMAISRFPKDRSDLMKPLLLHLLSEVGHGEMALEDFTKLGGDVRWARSRRITPASFAMGATCRALAQFESPFAYLGYMYLFEALTPMLAERVQEFLQFKDFPAEAQVFINVHAKEDIAHTYLLSKLIAQIVDEYAEAASAIEYGFDCFATVYPFPIWKEALANAKRDSDLVN